ncbi:MAG: PAS domain S-box protein [Candidatus Ozemobacteraceae bacterium]
MIREDPQSEQVAAIRQRAEDALQQAYDELEQRVEERTKELRRSEEKHRLFFACAGDAIFIHDEETRILAANPMACERLGYTNAELMSMKVSQVDSPEEAPHIPDRIARLREQGHLIFETVHQRKDRSLIPTEVSVQPITWDGQPALLSICRDITDRKLAEAEKEKLEAQNRQLQKAESLCCMARAIAHHFNNQLQVVSGYLEMAMCEPACEAGKPAKFLAGAMQAAHRAAEVSSLMLIYLGQTPGKLAPVNLTEACRHSLPLLMAAIPKNAVMEADFPSSGMVARANANQIQQVLSNLVTNAWEAGDKGKCVVHVSVKTALPSEISRLHRFPVGVKILNNTYVCLEVADTGSGIAAKDIDNIFDPFFSSKFPGRGMGLAAVLGIIRGHDGVITVDSEPGRGSTFRAYFPQIVEETSRLPEKVNPVVKFQGSGTILLVEDEEMVRNITEIMLSHLGFVVITAKDGIEAVEIFRHHMGEIRCILCDMTMPHMNGWDTLTAIRKLAPGIPVILASGHSEEQVLAGEHPERPQAFLSKPYQRAQLCEVIRQTLCVKQE